MYLDPDRKQFDFEELKDGSIAVTFRPVSSRLCKKTYFVLFRPKTRYHELAVKVLRNNANWVEISWFADFVKNHGKDLCYVNEYSDGVLKRTWVVFAHYDGGHIPTFIDIHESLEQFIIDFDELSQYPIFNL